jgi:cellulose biosynthesis protein BcsQ
MPDKYCPVIVFANHKGGVGKTTATVITAELLAQRNMKVLVIDTDSQGNTTEALGPANLSPTELPTVQACMEDVSKTEYCIVDSCFDNIQLIAGSIAMEQPFPSEPFIRLSQMERDQIRFIPQLPLQGDLLLKFIPQLPLQGDLLLKAAQEAGLNPELTSLQKTKLLDVPFIYRASLNSLQMVVERVRNSYDAILIDTAPSLGLTNQAAIFASDAMIMPCSTAKHAVYGIPDIVRMAEDIYSKRPDGKKLFRHVLITLVDKRTRMDKIGRNILLSKFDCIGEIPKVSRLPENMYTKRFILNRVEKPVRALIEDVVTSIYESARTYGTSSSGDAATKARLPVLQEEE